jgi:anti-sigma B factor antagonist
MSTTGKSRIFVETTAGVTVARFVDAQLIADETINDLHDQLNALAEGFGAGELVVSLREVRLMSSTVLAILLRFSRRVEKAGGQLKLCGIDRSLMDVFKITRFDRLFEIHDQEWEAIEAFKDRAPALARS